MTTAILSSTFFLTLLLAVGLFFFIRASAKDRTETLTFFSKSAEADLLEQLQQYFASRAYQVSQIEPEASQITLSGFVRPSRFLAIFLSGLAAIGILCFNLIFSFLFPQQAFFSLGLLLLAPLAGVFYWRRAGRREQVAFKVQPTPPLTNDFLSQLTIRAHRDELIQLRQKVPLTEKEIEPS
ncbi:cofactor assembly of complex C subunit B [Almyronema epifaneia]|uniref:Cofactor assembly of complex C subunit B n=1 Tax=Almyronema epifaneia S1 TaxID=2991925 RepID=A0ABW6IFX7_9CYAN